MTQNNNNNNSMNEAGPGTTSNREGDECQNAKIGIVYVSVGRF